MKFEEIPFYVDVTLCCGQVFRWDKLADWWYGVAGNKVFKIRQTTDKFEYVNADEKFVEQYFSLNDDLEKILDSVNKDSHIDKAIKSYWGLRLINQDPWECLISYICATYKSIPAIKYMLNNMAQKFGERVTFEAHNFYTFPTSEQLHDATELDLMNCGLGYRAKYVLATTKKVCDGSIDFDVLKKLPYLEAKKQLMALPGVGTKVADCVLLFSLGKTDAFPVDIWIKRVILNRYSEKLSPSFFKKLSSHSSLGSGDYERLNAFGRRYFGKYAGYAQEYLYHWERMQT